MPADIALNRHGGERPNPKSLLQEKREVQGWTLSDTEGWHAIAEANRICGFDGWDRETVETKYVIGRDNRGADHAVYVARVRITVRAEGKTVIRRLWHRRSPRLIRGRNP